LNLKNTYYPNKISTGQKLMVEIFDGTATTANTTKTRYYLGGLVMKGSKVEFINTPEGRALPKTSIWTNPNGTLVNPPGAISTWTYEYQLKDHLGNLRVACRCGDPRRNANNGNIQVNATREPAKAVQTEDYDAWGLSFGSPTVSSAVVENLKSKYLYNGKEQIQDLNLGLYEYGFRWYDAQTAKFVQVDPLADEYSYKSTYDYAENRPINGIDLDGLEYLNSNEARIILNGGNVLVNLKNMNNSTQRAWKDRDNAGRWPSGNIGYPKNVGRLDMRFSSKSPDALSFDNTMGANDPAYNNTSHKLERRIAKSTGQEDQRIKERSLSGASGMTPKLAGIAIMANLGMWGFETYNNFNMAEDRNLLNQHLDILKEKVESDFNAALKLNMVPIEYQNPNSVSAIMNYVLSGVTTLDDPKIEQIGKDIVKSISKNPRPSLYLVVPQSTGSTSDNTRVNNTNVKEKID